MASYVVNASRMWFNGITEAKQECGGHHVWSMQAEYDLIALLKPSKSARMQAEYDLMALLKPSKSAWTASIMVNASRMWFNGITEAKQECVYGIMWGQCKQNMI